MRKHIQDIGFGTQIRKSPYFEATLRHGAQAFSVYNHMYIPRDFGDPVENYWNLVNATFELNFRRFMLYTRIEQRYALGLGTDPLLERGWISAFGEGPSTSTFVLAWKW